MSSDSLILQRKCVAVLGVLNEEDHQEGDDGGAGVDDQLPGIAVTEDRPAHGPADDDQHRADERPGMTRSAGSLVGELREEGVAGGARRGACG